MTKAEMNRRIASHDAKAVARVDRLVRQSTYDPRELAELTRVPLRVINAVIQRYAMSA
jgi:hypothetical protein